ncbi:MAG: hypothetical protein VX899_18160 [Myxococcota bacterium]|nr:hypothetical protein [Myxococcota bacterium]
MSDTSRRTLIHASLASLGAAALSGCAPGGRGEPSLLGLREPPPLDTGGWGDTALETPGSCSDTPAFAEGPYYRDDAPVRADLRTAGETGTVLRLQMEVRSARDCRLLPDAIVDFWHVMQTGVYDLETEDMHYRCRLRTGYDGRVEVTTLKPISYYTDTGKLMPAHFHMKVTADGHEALTTQLRFLNDPDDDGQLPTELMLNPSTAADGSLDASFTFVLEPS